MTPLELRKVPRNIDFSVFHEQVAMVARSSKILYTPTPKVACSTIKTAIVLLEEPTRTVVSHPHDPSTYGVPTLTQVSREEGELVFTSPDWVRFCVTRRPHERLLSAWLNKIFAGRSLRTQPYAEAVQHTRDVGGQFREFVRGFNKDHPLFNGDQHFVSQVRLLHPETVPYTHIIDVSELANFAAWIRSSDPSRQGFDVSARLNPSLKVPLGAMYDRRTASVIEDLYKEDFDTFGYERAAFDEQAEEFLLTENELVLIERVASLEAAEFRHREMVKLADQRIGGRYGLQEVLTAVGGKFRRLV